MVNRSDHHGVWTSTFEHALFLVSQCQCRLKFVSTTSVLSSPNVAVKICSTSQWKLKLRALVSASSLGQSMAQADDKGGGGGEHLPAHLRQWVAEGAENAAVADGDASERSGGGACGGRLSDPSTFSRGRRAAGGASGEEEREMAACMRGMPRASMSNRLLVVTGSPWAYLCFPALSITTYAPTRFFSASSCSTRALHGLLTKHTACALGEAGVFVHLPDDRPNSAAGA